MEAFARQRLRRDWAEVLKEPSGLVAAAPLPDNIFEWHANLRPSTGPLAGITFHVRITFPADYPTSPPMLYFPREEIPSFRHPNLYSFGLCLDILSSFIGTSDKHAGWSPAYTVRTLLMQLQSFLFEFDNLAQDHGGSYSFRYDANRIRDVRREANNLVCRGCGHCWKHPQPALQEPTAVPRVPSQPPRATLEAVRKQVAETRAELAKLPQRPESASAEVDEQGRDILSCGNLVGHLSAVCQRLTVRVVALRPRGGLRFGLATAACTGLTEGMETDGSVAWDSRGQLVLGSVVHDQAMPRISVGDEVSVAVGSDGVLSFALNGEAVAHEARCIWPRRPLGFFLFNPSEPSARGSDGPVKDVRAMMSFRNASVEVLGDVALRDEVAVAARSRGQVLLKRLSEQEVRLEAMTARQREADERILRGRSEGAHRGPWSSELPREVLLSALMGVDADDVPALMRVCSGWRQLVEDRGLLERLQVCCFYTKVSAWQDVLGFGVSAEYHDDGNLKELSTELDVLSLTAFSKFNLRRGVWGEDFEYFLPLVLDGGHARRSLPILEESLVSLALGPRATARPFEPWMALAVLPQLMNSFAVSLMNAKDGVTRHSSEKALLGYCSFHHMLLKLASRHPCIARVAEGKLRNFLHSEAGRHKSQTPDLGQLLVYVTLSERFGWQDVAQAVADESSVRGVLWLLRESPRLESPKTSDVVLVRESFRGRLTGLRLLMFQAFFIHTVAAPDGVGPQEALARYNLQFGLPTVAQKEALFQAAKEILAVDSWPAYNRRLCLAAPRDSHQQACLLRQAMEESSMCGYHTPSARAWTEARKAASKEEQRRPARRACPPGERVGVKADLQRAFQRTAASAAPASAGKDTRKAATGKPAAAKLAANTQSAPIGVRNSFGALDTEEPDD